jgi:hypothetical protein
MKKLVLSIIFLIGCGEPIKTTMVLPVDASNPSNNGVVEQIMYTPSSYGRGEGYFLIIKTNNSRVVKKCETEQEMNLWNIAKVGDTVNVL